MSSIRRIAIVGCGGINSWVAEHIKKVTDIFINEKLIYVKLFDKDIIEEKNLKRANQNFTIKDLMEQKAKVLSEKYNFDHEETFITPENISLCLESFDDIILGVDNNKTRQMIYKFAVEHNKYLLDLRAQGTQMMYVVVNGKHDMDYYNKKYFANIEAMERKGSCQLTSDIENDHIENGNKIIAHFGVYGIYLKHFREEELTTDSWQFAY